MRPAVDQVHHGNGQGAGVAAAQVAIQRHVQRLGGGAGAGQRHGQDGVAAQSALVGRAVEFQHGVVDQPLIVGVHALQGRRDDLVDVLHGLQHALAAVALVSVAQFQGLVAAGAGPAGHDGAASVAALQQHFGLDGGVATAVQHFTRDDGLDLHDILRTQQLAGIAPAPRRCTWHTISRKQEQNPGEVYRALGKWASGKTGPVSEDWTEYRKFGFLSGKDSAWV